MIWYYKIINKYGKIDEGLWATEMKPSDICKWFENAEAELLILRQGSPITYTLFNFPKLKSIYATA